MYGYPAPPPPPKQGMSTVLVVVLALLGIFVLGGGILLVLAVFGVRSYVSASKTAEAMHGIGQMQKLAAAAYEMDRLPPSGLVVEDPAKVEHALCASASSPVPKSIVQVSGKKYMASPDEWLTDREANAGFACLRFEMTTPQYFQYDYKATKDSFTATAHGDLDGDGEASTFEGGGTVDALGGSVHATPLTSKRPDE